MYSSIPLTEDDIHDAFAIIQGFIEVTKHRADMEEKIEALMLHCEDLTISEELYAYIVAYCVKQFGDEQGPAAVVGTLIGLRIADCARVRASD